MKGADPPEEWLISRVCEEFQCTPSQVLKEDPVMVMRILDLRAYASAKKASDEADNESDLPESAMLDWVRRVETEIVRERRRKKEIANAAAG